MTETIKQKALALLNEARAKLGFPPFDRCDRSFYAVEALCRAIEQHEAFRQEVSDAVVEYFDPEPWNCERAKRIFSRFIIAKPDPLIEVLNETMPDVVGSGYGKVDAAALRAALAARGLEIREKQP